MKKTLIATLIGMILVVGSVGCANIKTEKASSATKDSVETKKSSTEETATQQTSKARIKVVALEPSTKPLSFEDEDGNFTGYEVDLIKEIDKRIPEYEFKLDEVSEDATQVGLETGKYALIGGGLYKTPEREEKFLIPQAISGVSLIKLYVRENDDSIKTIADLVGKKISPVSANGGIYNFLTKYNEEHPNEKVDIQTADDISLADRFKGLDEGSYDAVVIPNNLDFKNIKESLGLHIKEISDPVKVNPTYFVLNKKETDLNSKVNVALTKIREDGTLSKIAKKWYGEDTIAYYKE